MEKFLKLPIDEGTFQLVSITDLIAVITKDATNTELNYKSGSVLGITHASVSNDEFRDFIQTQIAGALQTSWTRPVYSVVPPVAVSAIYLA